MTRRRGELSCCGYFIRILLGLVNLLILLIGIGLVTVASLFKWSTVFDFVKKYDGLDAFVSVTTLDSIVIALLVIGAFLIVVSLVGFIACVTMNRFFLGVYEVLLVMIFLAHLGALIALLVLRPKFEETLKTEFNNVVLKINNASSYGISNDQLENAYTALNAISKTFTCCGINSPNDYSADVRQKACSDTTLKDGCGSKVIDFFKLYSIYVFVIPSAVVLFFELLTGIFVPYLFYKAMERH